MNIENMPSYQCHKKVRAMKIKDIVLAEIKPGRDLRPHLIFVDERYDPLPMSDKWVLEKGVIPGGYVVIYEDNYISYSPAKAFEEGYTLVDAGIEALSRELEEVFERHQPALRRRLLQMAGAAEKSPEPESVEVPEAGEPVKELASKRFPGLTHIASERMRQVDAEGYDAAHDDEHRLGELAQGAACYARMAVVMSNRGFHGVPVTHPPAPVTAPEIEADFKRGYLAVIPEWPFDPESFKPCREPLGNLRKAGAMIAAEIDRIHRKGGQ